MEQITQIIRPLYQKYLSRAEKLHLRLDLDIKSSAINPSALAAVLPLLDQQLAQSLSRRGDVQIIFESSRIILKDQGQPLNTSEISKLKNSAKTPLKITSRVGFGTTIEIPLPAPDISL